MRPNASIIQPGQTIDVSIILQEFSQPLPKDYKCKDKFLIVSLPSPDLSDSTKVSDHWPTLESKFKKDMVQKKLRVNYVVTDEQSTQDANAAHVKGNNGSGAPASSDGTAVGAAGATAGAAGAAGITGASTPSAFGGPSRAPVPETPGSAIIDQAYKQGHSHGKSRGQSRDANASTFSEKDTDSSPYKVDDSAARISSLNNKFDSNESKETLYPGPSASTKPSSDESAVSISLPAAAILALVSFLLGWLVF